MSGRESELGFDINEQYGSLMIASVVDALYVRALHYGLFYDRLTGLVNRLRIHRLYGVTSFQVYLYYQRWEQVKKDGWLAYMVCYDPNDPLYPHLPRLCLDIHALVSGCSPSGHGCSRNVLVPGK